MTTWMRAGALALIAALSATTTPAQEPYSRAESFEVRGFDDSRYFLAPARAELPEASKGHPLLVVLPGGDGSAEFLPFVQGGIFRGAMPDDFVGVMVTAVRWTADQQIVWPTERNPVDTMRYTTESYVEAVVDDVIQRQRIDRERVYLLSWSSSGPVAFDMSLARRTPFAGFYVAMSVFKPEQAALRNAKSRRFVLDQSPEDRVTPFSFADAAKSQLTAKGGLVWLRRYSGGHGWNDSPILRIREGLRWLDSEDLVPADDTAREPTEGRNLLHNGNFERGTANWTVLDNSRSLKVDVVVDDVAEGKQSLHITKPGTTAMDLVRQDVSLAGLETVQISARLKTKAADNVYVKFFIYGPDGEVLNEDVDASHIQGDRDWECVVRDYTLPTGAKSGALMIVILGTGEVWLDDARVTVPKSRS